MDHEWCCQWHLDERQFWFTLYVNQSDISIITFSDCPGSTSHGSLCCEFDFVGGDNSTKFKLNWKGSNKCPSNTQLKGNICESSQPIMLLRLLKLIARCTALSYNPSLLQLCHACPLFKMVIGADFTHWEHLQHCLCVTEPCSRLLRSDPTFLQVPRIL